MAHSRGGWKATTSARGMYGLLCTLYILMCICVCVCVCVYVCVCGLTAGDFGAAAKATFAITIAVETGVSKDQVVVESVAAHKGESLRRRRLLEQAAAGIDVQGVVQGLSAETAQGVASSFNALDLTSVLKAAGLKVTSAYGKATADIASGSESKPFQGQQGRMPPIKPPISPMVCVCGPSIYTPLIPLIHISHTSHTPLIHISYASSYFKIKYVTDGDEEDLTAGELLSLIPVKQSGARKKLTKLAEAEDAVKGTNDEGRIPPRADVGQPSNRKARHSAELFTQTLESGEKMDVDRCVLLQIIEKGVMITH